MKDKKIKPKVPIFHDEQEKKGHDLMTEFFKGDEKNIELNIL